MIGKEANKMEPYTKCGPMDSAGNLEQIKSIAFRQNRKSEGSYERITFYQDMDFLMKTLRRYDLRKMGHVFKVSRIIQAFPNR